MVVILNPKTSKEEIKKLTGELEALGVTVNPVIGTEMSILGLVGDTTKIDSSYIEANPYVERVMKVQEPFKKANRLFHPENTVIDVNGHTIGGNKIAIIAGPCSVESKEQISLVANEVKKYGASFLRGGAFKPRTSPYSFQGLKYEGLNLLNEAKAETGLPIVTELMSPYDIDTFVENYDLSGKTIVPFATSGGSGMGKTVDVLSKLSPNAKWQTGKMVNGISEKEIKNWVSNL